MQMALSTKKINKSIQNQTTEQTLTPSTMFHCQQLTNNTYALPMLTHASVIQQLPCTTSFNTSNSLQRNLKMYYNAERPIGESMREKYKTFLDTNLTLLFTLFKHLSMKTACRKDS